MSSRKTVLEVRNPVWRPGSSFLTISHPGARQKIQNWQQQLTFLMTGHWPNRVCHSLLPGQDPGKFREDACSDKIGRGVCNQNGAGEGACQRSQHSSKGRPSGTEMENMEKNKYGLLLPVGDNLKTLNTRGWLCRFPVLPNRNEDGIKANEGLPDGPRVTRNRDNTGTMALPCPIHNRSILGLWKQKAKPSWQNLLRSVLWTALMLSTKPTLESSWGWSGYRDLPHYDCWEPRSQGQLPLYCTGHILWGQRLSGTLKVPKDYSEKPIHGNQGIRGYLVSVSMIIRKHQVAHEKINILYIDAIFF